VAIWQPRRVPDDLDDRKAAVLRAIVEQYVASATPVGSATVTRSADLGVSAATVRNEMSLLEREGYIAQPHTSAGRVPTDRGYRYYVDHLAGVTALAAPERRRIAEFIGGSVFWSSAAWTPTALRTAKGLSLQQTGWIMSVLSLANMLGSFSLGSLSDKFGRKVVIALSAFPAALAAFIVFYWLQSPMGLAVGIFVFGIFKASVPALVVALAQEAAPPGSAGTASGIIMSLHYTAGVIAPLLAAKVIGATGDIILAMILATTVPLLIYGSLIALVRERSRTSETIGTTGTF